ncbi:hypothetical protein GH885_08850, partial [Gracilibacillus thailandensis]|nr:hypothetical protein [Gracilibacillus thailandensis]
MMQIIFSIVSVLWMVYAFFRVKQSIHMLQLNSYFNNRLWRWMTEHWSKVVPIHEWLALIFALLLFLEWNWLIFVIALLGLFVPRT